MQGADFNAMQSLQAIQTADLVMALEVPPQRASPQARNFRERTDPFQMFSDEEFRKRYRFSKATASTIVDLVKGDLEQDSRGRGTPPHLQVLTAIRCWGRREAMEFAEKWPLVDPNEIVFLLIAYLAFVFKIGPLLMEKRRPFQMKSLLIGYNIFQIANSAILAYSMFRYILDKGLFPRSCKYDSVTNFTIAVLYWKYMISKVLDLFDTVFYVLRKKWQQITFLHIYHHVVVVLISWSSLKYDPTDHWAFMALVNCSVHAVMYTYYAIAALGPEYAKYLWWKRYLTIMQLGQFVTVSMHLVIQAYISDCPMHSGFYWVGLANFMMLFILFMDFYRKRYNAGPRDVVQFACVQRND